jgi:hypothetical protein
MPPLLAELDELEVLLLVATLVDEEVATLLEVLLEVATLELAEPPTMP